MLTPEERAAVVAEARTWIGTPYHNNAAVKGSGADCALMPLSVYRTVLPRLPQIEPPKYVAQWHLHRGEELYLDYVRALGGIEIIDPQPGDFALFKVGRLFSHGAIVDERGFPRVIHAVAGSGVIYGDINSEPRLAKTPRFYFSL